MTIQMFIVNMFTSVFSAVSGWWQTLIEATGMESFRFAFIVIFIVVSLVLMPLRTGGTGIAQDTFNPRVWKNKADAKKRKEESKKGRNPYSKI